LGEKLGENRLKIISLMKKDSKISITEIADKVGISTTSIEKNIGYLKKQGIVRCWQFKPLLYKGLLKCIKEAS